MEWRKHKRSCGRRRTIRSGRRGFSGEVLHPSKNICTLHTQPYSWTHPHIPHIHGYNQPHVHNINYIFHTHYLYGYTQPHVHKGRVASPKVMNFWKSSKRPLIPPPHFRKIMLRFFPEYMTEEAFIMAKICNINFWIGNDPPPLLELFQKFISFGDVIQQDCEPHSFPKRGAEK